MALTNTNLRRILASAVFAISVLGSRFEVYGEQVVVPNEYENAEAPNKGGIPTGPFRFQQVFAASQFASLGPGAHRIVSFSMRPDSSVTDPFAVTFANTVMKMSTTNKNPGELSLMFSENVGADELTAFQGDFTFSTVNMGPLDGPKDFDLDFELQMPFAYDPSKGNLIFDIATDGTDLSISQTTDFVSQPGPDFEEVVGPGTGELATDRYGGNIIRFTFAPALAGDYDRSGMVDAADYVVWRKGLGTTYTQADYDLWRANFGAVSPSIGAGSGAADPLSRVPASAQPLSAEVPEPSAFAVAAILFLAVSFCRMLTRSKVSDVR